jgi:hypothetical protein
VQALVLGCTDNRMYELGITEGAGLADRSGGG